MKLSFWRLAIVNLLAVCLLNIVGTQVSYLLNEIDANSTSPRRSEAIGTDRFLFMRNGKFGYIDRNGKIAIPARYVKAEDFSEGLAAVSLDDKIYGYIDTNGKMTISPKFESVRQFKNGLAVIERKDNGNSKYGYIDRTGKMLIPVRYTAALEFNEDLAVVGIEGKYGYIDTRGKVVIPLEFSDAWQFSEGLAAVGNGDPGDLKYGYLNPLGKVVIPFKFSAAYEFKNGLAQVRVKDKENNTHEVEIDRTGKVVPSSTFLDWRRPRKPREFSNGLLPKIAGDRLGYEDKAGKLVIPTRYGIPDRAMGQHDDELSISLCGDNDGRRCVQTSIDFHGGLAAVILPGQCGLLWTQTCYGYIDTTGKLVFKF
jgi:DNA-binding transcriptional regulator/RsmH inhibitor MraZ